jgi:NAD(P)-dependent dehydrogenase (short-subunit alcohol dehydrogenase family)
MRGKVAMTERVQIDLTGRTVVIAGAGGAGIGTACVTGVLQCGGDVIALDNRAQALDALGDEIANYKGHFHLAHCDLRDEDQVRDALSAAQSALAPLYGVVTVAGGQRPTQWGPMATLDIERFDEVVDLNVRASFIALRQVASALMHKGHRGSLVSISSVAGLSALPYGASYAASKAALNSLVRSASLEWGPHAIRVNAVCAGSIRTGKNAAFNHPLSEAERSAIPLGRRGVSHDISNAVLFLLSDLSSWISGQTLVVDGGSSIRPSFLDDENLPVFVTDPTLRASLRKESR